MPFFVLTIEGALRSVDRRLEDVARTLGAGRWTVFRSVTLPLIRPSLQAGAILAWARALGEFGATILLAGNIPGQTQTLSLAIYNFVQLGKDSEAFTLLGITVALAFLFVWCSEWLLRSGKRT